MTDFEARRELSRALSAAVSDAQQAGLDHIVIENELRKELREFESSVPLASLFDSEDGR